MRVALVLVLGALAAAACGLDLAGTNPSAPTDGGASSTSGGSSTSSSGAGEPDSSALDDGGGYVEDAAPAVDAGGYVGPEIGKDTSGCPRGRGPVMVRTASYCIDATEVTEGQYRAFLEAMGGARFDSPHASCTGKQNHLPSPPPPQGALLHCPLLSDATLGRPIVCVDWCDAHAFCAWAGKRLCGAIGGGSIKTNGGDYRNSGKDEWYAACLGPGGNDFAYGKTFEPNRCNSFEDPNNRPLDVMEKDRCTGGVAGLYDMVGNVRELENACSGPEAAATCLRRGGGWDLAEGACNNFSAFARNGRDDTTGFRCCADP
ncbi:MAG: SUMF1/EgtB/PvdO family nonheme iron enzyme [Labilithrix sp.]|nr:SUMF1/EgtB/PvdO family nonheme iron enzyme [Labilithrix sp.]MCW5811179.1 SUMF1/EgtB/PvdO family nonheme iron enzyme [Labilithrix sp.]